MIKIVPISLFLLLCFGIEAENIHFNPLDVDFGTNLEQFLSKNSDCLVESSDTPNIYIVRSGSLPFGATRYVRCLINYITDEKNKINAVYATIRYFLSYIPELPQMIFDELSMMNENKSIRPDRYFRHVQDPTIETIEWKQDDYIYGMIFYHKPVAGILTAPNVIELYKTKNPYKK